MNFDLGLVSVSFRRLEVEKIIEIAKNAGLSSIEWGGDIHVPSGRVDIARYVGERTRAAGLKVAEYGSYYRLGVSSPDGIDGAAASALALGTDTVRVWAHDKGSENISECEYAAAVEDARRICARYPELTFCTECHNNTVTDDYRANLRFLRDVDMPNFAAFWQPNQFKSHEYNLESAKCLAPYVRAAHVFAWEGVEKYPLSHHRERWAEYIGALSSCRGREEMHLMLEFMHDDDPDTLALEARELFDVSCGLK